MATTLEYNPSSRSFGSSTMPYPRPPTSGSSRPYGHAATQQLADKETLSPQASLKRPSESDSHYLNPHHNSGSRPTLGSAISRSGSEADSLLDLYGPRRSQASVGAEKHDVPAPALEPQFDEEDTEQSRWIHRDKLAMIESKELREAGIQVPVPARTSSKAKRRRQHSHDRGARREREPSPFKEDLDRHAPVPPPSDPREVDVEEHGPMDFDFRTPEEIAADSYTASSLYRQQPGLRASSSRIPIARSGPVPLPQEPLGRSAPLSRTRGASGTWIDEDGISHPKSRSRTQSFGSQVLLDDLNHQDDTPNHSRQQSTITTPISPSKTRNANNRPTTSSNNHSRKPSTSNGVRNFTSPEQSRSPTGASAKATPTRSTSAPRPKSRSGLETRPPTAVNRPEGEPPWLATMYKPDPRLPPDQQLLPTHAKRMQQQEEATRAAEKDNAHYYDGESNGNGPGGAAGRDSASLGIHDQDGLRRSPVSPSHPSPTSQLDSPASQGGAWPLKPLTSPLVPNTRALNRSPSRNPSPVSPLSTDGGGGGGATERLGSISGSAGGGHGGYSTMPKVHTHGNGSAVGLSSPVLGGPRGRSPLPDRMDRREKMERPGMHDGGQRKKGCGCCVVM